MTKAKIEPRKRPRQERSQAVVETIMSATHRLIEQNGVQKLSTNAIASEAGLSVGSLYQYFPNKEAIILALAQRWLALFVPVAGYYAERPVQIGWHEFAADMRAFTVEIASIYAANRALLSVMDAMQAHPELREIVREHDREVIGNHARWLMNVDPRLSAENAQRLGFLIFESGDACFTKALAAPDLNYDDVVRDVASMHIALLRSNIRID